MLLNYLTDLFFTYLRDFLDILNIQAFELASIPSSILVTLHSLISTAFFFIPLSTVPIFVIVPTIWLGKIVISIVDGLLGIISRTPIIKHL